MFPARRPSPPTASVSRFIARTRVRGWTNSSSPQPDGTQQRIVAARKYRPADAHIDPRPGRSTGEIAAAIEGSDTHGFYTKLMVADAASAKLDIIEQPRFQFVERIAWMKGTRSLFAIGQEQDSSFQQIWYVPTGSGTANTSSAI